MRVNVEAGRHSGEEKEVGALAGQTEGFASNSFSEIEKYSSEKSHNTRKTAPILGPAEAEDGMEGWDGEASWNRDGLERIVALLFALANLAGLAAGAPYLRRRQVLGILSYAEAEARAFIMGVAFGETAPADMPGETCDAAGLAASFRALALALCALLARAALFKLPGAAGPRAAGRLSRGMSWPAVRCAPAPSAPDTS